MTHFLSANGLKGTNQQRLHHSARTDTTADAEFANSGEITIAET